LLGRLIDVPVRDVWPHEARDFTPWLLANADVLSDVLHMDLELREAEHPVGDFSLDLVGVDTATGDRVIVENQLERSDHLHLGQILTYAGGTDPVNIVWVAPDFRDEHRAAIDWLNSRTDAQTRFFAVVVSVVRIGASSPAPLLRLVAEPNDWGKSVRALASAGTGPSDRNQLYQQFWQRYIDTMHERGLAWTRSRGGPAQNWLDLSAGMSDISYKTTFAKGQLRSDLYFGSPDAAANAAWFAAALGRRAEMESAFGASLEWEQLPDRKASRIAVYRDGAVDSAEAWPEYINWFLDTQQRLRAAVASVGGVRALIGSAHD